MKKYLLCIFVVTLLKSNPISAQKLFVTVNIEKINQDDSSKSVMDFMRAITAIAGTPADSIIKSNSKVFLYYGAYKVIISNKEDYLFYLDRAIEYREMELQSKNREYQYGPNSNQPGNTYIPRSNPTPY